MALSLSGRLRSLHLSGYVLLKELSCVVKNTPEVNYMED